ncbi:MAG TPA: prenyltransferase/squalene oxidase repeat-containing protein, partial [Phycisphaerales bacterium]|nr:prenyltransferase/squalene oxidase repeat-containing protein [Phycisphaerales bacterium]
MKRRDSGWMRLGACAAMGVWLVSFGADNPPTTKPVPMRKEILAKPDKPLDERVNPAKMTTLDLPTLPEHVVMPMPPEHRIAETADQVPMDKAHWDKAHEVIRRGMAYLEKMQNVNGAWSMNAEAAPTDKPEARTPVSTAITSLVLKALIQADGSMLKDERFAKGVSYLIGAQRQDGSFDDSQMANYVNSSVVSALATIGDRGEYQDRIRVATQAMVKSQWDQSEGLDPTQDWFGGAGYGSGRRPDLSNTQMMLDALYDSGMSPEEPAFQRALAFATRCQNFKKTNDATWAGDDGGFVYTTANGGESAASAAAGEGSRGEKLPEGEPKSLRSYGSMTYAGFKSLLYAGLSANDDRVRAAYDWIIHHFTFDENPGVGQQGLYYYLHSMSRALYVAQQNVITDANGVKHNWREELIDAIAKRQLENGSWVNDADRWMEGNPVLVTA